jgi:murein DD-endopeptidase MepM/ murein hydrolase activator NlpD
MSYTNSHGTPWQGRLLLAGLIVLAVLGMTLAVSRAFAGSGQDGSTASAEPRSGQPVATLPAVRARTEWTDTVYIGGYARGSFQEAVSVIASEFSPAERDMVGRHLDRVFEGALQRGGLGQAGRLRVAAERTLRPDGSTRAVRVLAAETAVGGELHRAFFFERDGTPGYFDPLGRSLDPRAWVMPIEDARVTSGFGLARMHPILRRVLPHTGVDYAAPHGTPIRATADGTVSIAGPSGGYGNLVELQHANGYATRYAHLARIAAGVAIGTPVRQGEVIGFVGMTGLATGPHLHYEVRRQGRAVDPAGISLAMGPAADLSTYGPWLQERGELQRLLSRTPSLAAGQRAR